MNCIKAIIFDNEWVIVKNDWNNVSQLACPVLGIEPPFDGKSFKKALSCGDEKLLGRYSRGEMDSECFWKQVMMHFNSEVSDHKIKKLQDGMAQLTTEVDPDAIQVLQNLKESGYRLFMLSNSNADLNKGNRERNDYFLLFEKCYFSFEMGCRKPEDEAYERVLQENNLQASECLFIDDKEENLEAAKARGINTFWHKIDEGDPLPEKLAFLLDGQAEP